MNLITCYLKKLYKKLSRESQILNVQSVKGIYDFIYISLGIFFMLRSFTNIIKQKYFFAIANGIGLLILCFLKVFYLIIIVFQK